MSFKYIYLLLLLKITTSLSDESSQTEEQELKQKYIGNPALVQDAIDTHMMLQNGGIFEYFVRDYLDLLSTSYPGRMLKHYIRVLGKELDKLEYKYSKKLAKYVISLGKESREDIKGEMQSLRTEFRKQLPHRKDFLKAMNKVYTLRENILFRNYILSVKDYGDELIPFIHEETKKIINDAILNPILKMSYKDQENLQKKLKSAYKEYKNITSYMFIE